MFISIFKLIGVNHADGNQTKSESNIKSKADFKSVKGLCGKPKRRAKLADTRVSL